MIVRVLTLGRLAVYAGQAELTSLLAQPVRCAMLVYLAVEGETTRDALLATFWPEREPERARHSLSQTLYELRRELGEDWLEAQGERLRVTDVVETDAVELDGAVARADLEGALKLYGGHFLEGVHLAGTHEFEVWCDRQRARLSRLHRKARSARVNECVAAGDQAAALAATRRWVELDPLDDEAQHRFIELLAETGQRSEAIRQYEAYAGLLQRELEVEPLDETKALVARIREGAVETAAARLPLRGEPSPASAAAEHETPEAEAYAPLPSAEPRRGMPSFPRVRSQAGVIIAYLVMAWLAAQVTDTLVDGEILPSWCFPLVLVVLAAGLPVAVLLGWSKGEERVEAVATPTRHRWLRGTDRRRSGHVLAVLGALILGLLAARISLKGITEGAGPLDPNRIIVFPLVVSSDDARARLLGEDVATWIGWALEGTSPLKWEDGWDRLDRQQKEDVRLLSLEAARSIARTQRAAYYLDGRLVLRGDSVDAFLVLHDVDGDSVVGRARAYAPATEYVQAGLRAVAKLLPALLPPEHPVDLVFPGDRSPAALANFLLGERAYRRLSFEEALDYYRRAVAEDSSFAVAALKGAQAASWARQWSQAERLVSLALEHVATFPRQHALFARGLEQYLAGLADSAVAGFRQALEVDPDWRDAWMALGEVYMHLLPSESPLDSLAEAAFEEARRLDPEFAPVFFHLIEIAVGKKQLGRADSLMQALRRTSLESSGEAATVDELLTTSQLMLTCVERSPAAVDWPEAVRRWPQSVWAAASSLAVGALQAECARAAWRALLDHDSDEIRRFGALLGLQSLLVAQARYDEAAQLLDAEVSAPDLLAGLHIFDAVAGASMPARAGEAAERFRGYYRSGSAPAGSYSLYLWFLGTWEAHRGDAARAQEIADSLAALAASSGSRRDRLLAASVAARTALAGGDSARALHLLRVLVPTKRREQPWDAWETLGGERLAEAELLLARGEFLKAWRVAADLDAPARPPSDLVFLPASLSLRLRAARALGDGEMMARCRTRLAALGREELAGH